MSVASVDTPYKITTGRAHPLGTTVLPDGVNISLYSEHASRIELLLFDDPKDPVPTQVVPLCPEDHNTFHFWHAFVHGLRPGAGYAFRVHGPQGEDAVREGHRFDPEKVLLDPYAHAVETALWDRGAACRRGDNLATSLRGIVVDLDDYDWEGDRPLDRSVSDAVIYELHVGGFTRAANSGVSAPGTYQGVVERIGYLKELGVTAVELLPVFHFDPGEVGGTDPTTGERLSNYWGYSPLAFFAPHSGYRHGSDPGAPAREFRDMVKALHRAGIQVILDVVFNHTGEGNQNGPTISFKGIDNAVYYFTVPGDRQYYLDYTGTGNTLNCNHPVVDKFIVDCLTFWVREMHVDGFRFDLGSVLTRGEDGAPMTHPPVIWNIELSEDLLDTTVIAEAWDAGGLYQVGRFPGFRWGEWNGRYRDTLRRFVAGTPGILGDVADRLAGSSDLYQASGRVPVNSVNFVSCHDGFTLGDLVCYDGKHNEANGENNADGADDNASWNCGREGPSDDPGVEALRNRQVKNLLALLLLSQGVPMINMGDEVRRTQRGNNNAYCQDNKTSWFDWEDPVRHHDTLRFTQRMIAFRAAHPELHRQRYFDGRVNGRGVPDVRWHGCRLDGPGWDDPWGRALAFTLGAIDDHGDDLHVIANMSDEVLGFDLPVPAERSWVRTIDTSLPEGADIADEGAEQPVTGRLYLANPHSVVVLASRPTT
ncbi:MAG: glycogen debranching protein GlgX [Actinomycetales bacterium]|nr:glycogen debranching protein GlgX [Actinomycetales bacterium]